MNQKFEFKYDEESDDLFIYLPAKKSKGAVELGNFIFDFDENENLVALQILEASYTISKLITRIIELNKVKSIETQIINFRNMTAIRIEVSLPDRKESVVITIPEERIGETNGSKPLIEFLEDFGFRTINVIWNRYRVGKAETVCRMDQLRSHRDMRG